MAGKEAHLTGGVLTLRWISQLNINSCLISSTRVGFTATSLQYTSSLLRTVHLSKETVLTTSTTKVTNTNTKAARNSQP